MEGRKIRESIIPALRLLYNLECWLLNKTYVSGEFMFLWEITKYSKLDKSFKDNTRAAFMAVIKDGLEKPCPAVDKILRAMVW